MSDKYIVHLGKGAKPEENVYQRFVENYATSIGYGYQGFGLDCDFFKSSTVIKGAKLCVIWNGSQGKGPLCTKLCNKRGIPKIYFEWGMLPQSETFLVDPKGFCGDSILNESLHWVTDEDRNNMKIKRAELQYQYPLQDEGFILAPMQIEADSQILYHSRYNNMNEFIEHVESLYPNDKIIFRPHPKSGSKNNLGKYKLNNKNSQVILEGDFLHWASRASRVVGITSTTLYEAGILGVPVTALGDHPLNTNKSNQHDDVLAGALFLTVKREGGQLSKILNRFNIKPLR